MMEVDTLMMPSADIPRAGNMRTSSFSITRLLDQEPEPMSFEPHRRWSADRYPTHGEDPHSNEKGAMLLKAVRDGEYDHVVRLLDEGAPINYVDAEGWTALHFAATTGNANLCNVLCERGSNPTLRNSQYETPIDVALAYGNTPCVSVISAHWQPSARASVAHRPAFLHASGSRSSSEEHIERGSDDTLTLPNSGRRLSPTSPGRQEYGPPPYYGHTQTSPSLPKQQAGRARSEMSVDEQPGWHANYIDPQAAHVPLKKRSASLQIVHTNGHTLLPEATDYYYRQMSTSPRARVVEDDYESEWGRNEYGNSEQYVARNSAGDARKASPYARPQASMHGGHVREPDTQVFSYGADQQNPHTSPRNVQNEIPLRREMFSYGPSPHSYHYMPAAPAQEVEQAFNFIDSYKRESSPTPARETYASRSEQRKPVLGSDTREGEYREGHSLAKATQSLQLPRTGGGKAKRTPSSRAQRKATSPTETSGPLTPPADGEEGEHGEAGQTMSAPVGESKPRIDRKCGECGTTDTPQWRGGPNGAATLCNACGLKFFHIQNREKKNARRREKYMMQKALKQTAKDRTLSGGYGDIAMVMRRESAPVLGQYHYH
eukprot:comp18804_c1_seq1/m.20755 comp18804_c1_seq1/g.20755  ORF comp18804_c1_seq1/g.20755 comp18804_c1_seq1/m.20755 type:complete len:603 (-) comp18804_c1_seq1:33-1841(-)